MDHASEKTSRKPRSDSLRNREQLLVAARDVFSVGGPDASLEAVARSAGVGIGTLYRHFPTRESLFQAVYRREVDQLVELAKSLAAERPPLEALRLWLHANIGMVATKKGMLAALAPAAGSSTELFAYSAAQLGRSVGDLMKAAIAAGEIRDDIASEDVMRALIGMCYTREQPGWQETVIRLVDVFVDGLRLRPEPD
ncbi:TetR/AcrR family transcriptional regulator [Mesorhizobium sp. B2-4-15]|uniref:TetR/AcrR family transcriptional regulator n=1 Tax=Mesorhizobium sp. B2-4-15 TaxID=2589934 RepID=UPI00114E6DB6|nr:TetR/AcrR family transcriptional regulator [Mesorhizobium sp. B2-4-15]TPK71409.1 TetR/AcrR family transcriptional regulator [Mesorhizobium sp. B2-4-15]